VVHHVLLPSNEEMATINVEEDKGRELKKAKEEK